MSKGPFRFVNEDTVFTLPWEVGILEGLFERAGIEVEVAREKSLQRDPRAVRAEQGSSVRIEAS